MENIENKSCGMCSCGGNCGCGHHHKHMMKWLIKIALLVIVFCFAFKMGELKGMLEARGFGGYRYGPAMMYGNGAAYDTGIAPSGPVTAPAPTTTR